jgi:hypothetical protein
MTKDKIKQSISEKPGNPGNPVTNEPACRQNCINLTAQGKTGAKSPVNGSILHITVQKNITKFLDKNLIFR